MQRRLALSFGRERPRAETHAAAGNFSYSDVEIRRG